MSNSTNVYIDKLQDIVKHMNKHVNRITKMAPEDVTEENWSLALLNTNEPYRKTVKPAYSIGDYVRISVERIFTHKEQTGTFSREVFQIANIDTTVHPVVYKLRDIKGEPIVGNFYHEELAKTTLPDAYQVQVLKTRKRKGRTGYFVNWLGQQQGTEWIDSSQLV